MAYLTALPNQEPLRVVAADSNAMNTQLLVEALARDPHLQMIESPSEPEAILCLIKQEKPQIVVVSARLGESGSASHDLIREIRTHSATTRVIVLLDASERTAVIDAFRSGAQGIFCRTEPFRLLGKCIQCVHQGQIWASSSELQFVLGALAQPALADFTANGGSVLSAREIDVVRCVAEGMTNREIAQRLKLTEHTVKNYLFRIFDKLGVSSRVEVVLFALGSAAPRSANPEHRRQSQPVNRTTRGTVEGGPVAVRKVAT